jgi:hypothetical protein
VPERDTKKRGERVAPSSEQKKRPFKFGDDKRRKSNFLVVGGCVLFFFIQQSHHDIAIVVCTNKVSSVAPKNEWTRDRRERERETSPIVVVCTGFGANAPREDPIRVGRTKLFFSFLFPEVSLPSAMNSMDIIVNIMNKRSR